MAHRGDGYGRPEEITFDSELMACLLGGNLNWEARHLRVGATSFLTPPMRIYDIDLATGERTLLREQPVLGDYRHEDYVERRNWAVAEDGTRIPISLITGRRPNSPPHSAVRHGVRVSEDRGSPSRDFPAGPGDGVLDRASRGGGEMGRMVVRARQAAGKKNTFTDFIAAASHLIGVTRPQNLVALGGSAGGLLMGAVANMALGTCSPGAGGRAVRRPVDHHLDPSLPLTVTEWDSGKPLAGPRRLLHEVPFAMENVEAKEYPAILAMTSLNDTGCSTLSQRNGLPPCGIPDRPNPVLLRTQMAAGRWHQWPLRTVEGSRLPVRLAAGDG